MTLNDNKNAELMFKAILTLKDVKECEDFFLDVCTIKEVKSIAQRFMVAKMLLEKKVYNEIAAETGASTATISRVSRALYYGNGSYQKAFERLAAEDTTNEL